MASRYHLDAGPRPLYWPCRLELAGGGCQLIIRDLRPLLDPILNIDAGALDGIDLDAVLRAVLGAVSWPGALKPLPGTDPGSDIGEGVQYEQ